MSRFLAKLALLAVTLGGLAATGCYAGTAGGAIAFHSAPPAPQVSYYAPRDGQVWVEGRWVWTAGGWSWTPGYWIDARPGYVYAQGYWDYRGGQYLWIDGRWLPRRTGHVWVRGHWDYRGGQYYWVQGRFVRQRPGHVWVRGRYISRNGTRVWSGGHWRPGSVRDHRARPTRHVTPGRGSPRHRAPRPRVRDHRRR